MAREAQVLERQLQEARAEVKSLKGAGAGAAAAGAGSAAAAGGALEQKLAEVAVELKIAKEAEEEIAAELDDCGSALENLQEQNTRLLLELKAKDDENYKLLTMRPVQPKTAFFLRLSLCGAHS